MVYGIASLPIAFRSDVPPIRARWDAFFGSMRCQIVGPSPLVTVALLLGGKPPADGAELLKTECTMDFQGCRQWRLEGLVLTEFCWGAGWVLRDERNRRVLGSLKPGAVRNAQLVNVFVIWGVIHTLDLLWQCLPSHLMMLHGSGSLGGSCFSKEMT